MGDLKKRTYRGKYDDPFSPLEGNFKDEHVKFVRHRWRKNNEGTTEAKWRGYGRKEVYLPGDESTGLVEAVQVAMSLRRPLLLEGEPGCGKTRLAHAVAYELGYPLLECYVHSTKRAKDLLYTYDPIMRLYDLHDEENNEARTRAADRGNYVTLGPLGEAIALAAQGCPSVVLIDEIDKGDFDFPNDLLWELDRLKFYIEEANCEIDAKKDEQPSHLLPIIIITSNQEKVLPKPFLRRCIYHYLQFPKEGHLKEILKRRAELYDKPQDMTEGMGKWFDEVVTIFNELRKEEKFWVNKKPSTSELIDWSDYLLKENKSLEDLKNLHENKGWNGLPGLGTLVKTEADWQAIHDDK